MTDPSMQNLPRGIEVLLKKASVDPEFQVLLLERRGAAAKEIDLELTPAEAAMLAAIPREQLEKIIEQTQVPPESRRIFLGKVGTAMLAVLGAGIVWEIYRPRLVSKGISPDRIKRKHEQWLREQSPPPTENSDTESSNSITRSKPDTALEGTQDAS